MESLKLPKHVQDAVEPVHITVRFSASLPDLPVTIDEPTTATAATLKQRIRQHVPAELSDRRIRLIYSGRALVDTAALSTQLRLLPSSRSASGTSTPNLQYDRADGKGKAPVYDPPLTARVYIHCSIGDVTLSATDLALEASQATSLLTNDEQDGGLDASDPSAARGSKGAGLAISSTSQHQPSPSSTTPAPRGFDRLLAAGFTPEEIRTLRSQFLAIQAHSHTPDTMPSPSTLRAMEDRWLDNDMGSSGTENDNVGGGGGGGLTPLAGEEDASGALDDLIWGAVMGFFWPVGCLWWACREEGIWSRRKKWAVVLGVMINVGIGGLRWLS